MLMALPLEGVSHGARSCANLSTALASTNLCGIAALSPTDATAVMKIPSKRFTAFLRPFGDFGLSFAFDFVPLWTAKAPFKKFDWTFYCEARTFFCTSSTPSSLRAQCSTLFSSIVCHPSRGDTWSGFRHERFLSENLR